MPKGPEIEAAQPGSPVPGLVGRLLARAYGAELARRNRRFDAGRGVVRFDRAVISVGNLSVGGTGKTPMVMHVVGRLLAAGRRPCIAMRGYARGGAARSDEEALYLERFPDLPVVAQPNRVDGLIRRFAVQGEAIDSVVLDDGFQHRRIARDLDIVLIDATGDPFADRLLPAGRLREPAASLARAHRIVLTHAEAAPAGRLASLRQRLGEAFPTLPVAVARHEWSGLVVADRTGERVEPAAWLRGRRVLAACAIGNPGPFLLAARDAGAVVTPLVLRDHDPYAEGTLRRLLAGAAGMDAVLTTEKDWTKLRRVPADRWPCAVARARLGIAFDEGGGDLDRAVAGVAAAP